MPPEPFRVRSLPIGYGIFISARLLVRLIILYNAPFAQTKRQKFAASARYVKNRGECRRFPRCGRQPKVDRSVANFRLTTQSAPNARTSAPCRALQSLYKPMTCNDHGSTSAPVFPSRCGSFGQGRTKSAGGLTAVVNGGVEFAHAVSIKTGIAVHRFFNDFKRLHI
ncbi:TPA: hypothetical protein ACKLPB_002006, partial [Neisseria gonorrhoeae]